MRLDQSKEIDLKEEIRLSFNRNDDFHLKKNKDAFVEEFEECMSKISKAEGEGIQKAGILIGTEQTFLNVTPVDFNEDSSSISSHILWELSNYFPETYKNFNIKYYRLNNNYPGENIDDILLIAVNKNKLEFIKNLCSGSGIKILNVEIDHFAVEKCLKEIYPDENKNHTMLVIGCRDGRFDYSLIENELLKYYSYDIFERADFKNLLISQINTFNSSLFNIEKIFLYGDENTIKTNNFLKEQFQFMPVTIVSPEGNEADSKFAPLYGLALKNLA
ncbi:MAG: pilus assembly protein PilM [Ignavibacteria bacterium]|nr:pilus assembly protein PilM [Ignavibacteria bacterium]